ncbi:gamma-interferon-inducible lysosomal thiol reductase [Plakobranchus ocellatus]|uniref:Gamma-interferon-inducible lysosomal thiol reductase n=1 Tax=Plakobranchus ocellatus TaxID=259542 RepID=A0AAV4CAK8_9GAST|nr:gamma-interferon-inducible lysosomal thiol reductase [Plakobranchus ocellatus]
MATSFQLAMAFAFSFYLAKAAPPVVSMEMEQAKANPVNMTVYYESLCPGCNFFITQELHPLWPKIKDLDLMTVNLLPFGNAQERRIGFQWEFTCQHGKAECTGNIVETCMIHYYPDTTKQLNMVACFNANYIGTLGADWQASLQNCSKTGVDVEKIKTCVTGHEGNNLEHIMAMNTGPHGYTPFIMLDGVVNPNAEDHLLSEVCRVYKGVKPPICSQ